MRRLFRFFPALFLLSCLGLTGCVSVKSYVDPSFKEASYADLQKQAALPIKLNTEFYRNGQRFPAADRELAGHAERSLRATQVFDLNDTQAKTELTVTANNIADTGEAFAKGFGTGLTFGAAGSVVTDYYEFSVTLKKADGSAHKETLKHALHTTVGNKAAPVASPPTTLADGFARIVEQIILNATLRMQNLGVLAPTTANTPIAPATPADS